jgi:predicted aspartyl protease
MPFPNEANAETLRVGSTDHAVIRTILGPLRSYALLAVPVLELGCGSDCEQLGNQGELCDAREATVAIDPSYGGPVVPARLGGIVRPLLIDTGAEGTTLSSSLLGVADRTMLRVDELCLGDLCLRDASVYAWETPFSSAESGKPAGFIGMRWLRHFVLGIDHGRSVTLKRKGGLCSGDHADLSFTEYGIPMAPVTIDGQSFPDTVVDTGAVFTVLAQASADSLGGYLKETAQPTGYCTVDGCSDTGAFLSSVKNYCVGGHCQSDVPVKFPVWDAVGSSFLFQYRVDFDFAAGRLVFCAE